MKVAGRDINKTRDSILGKEFETNNCGKCLLLTIRVGTMFSLNSTTQNM